MVQNNNDKRNSNKSFLFNYVSVLIGYLGKDFKAEGTQLMPTASRALRSDYVPGLSANVLVQAEWSVAEAARRKDFDQGKLPTANKNCWFKHSLFTVM